MATAEVTPNVAAEPAAASVDTTASTEVTTSTGAESTQEQHLADFDSPEAFIQSAIDKQKGEAPETEEAEQPEVATTEEEQPELEAKPEETTQEEPETLLEDDEVLSPKALAGELDKDPAAKKFFDSKPELKNKVFAALRRDSENRELRQLYPDIETAKQAAEASATYQILDDLQMAVDSPEGADKFLTEWATLNIVRDANGNPVKENGVLQLNPQYSAILDRVGNNHLDYLLLTAQKSGNERLVDALQVVKEETTQPSSATDELPAHLKATAENLKAREDALNRQQSEQQEQVNRESLERVSVSVDAKSNALLKPTLDKAALTPFAQDAARAKIETEVVSRLKAHPLYNAQRSRLLSKPASPEREKALVAHDMKYINQFLGPIAAKVIREAGTGAVQAQKEKTEKIAAQKEASRTEPRGTSAGAPRQASADPKAQVAQWRAEYAQAHKGEEMPSELILQKQLDAVRQRRA